MKRNLNIKTLVLQLFSLFVVLWTTQSCETKDKEYLGELSPYIALEDVRALHKGKEIKLDKSALSGASTIYGVVISDHSEGNMPEGTIILQQWKRNRLRGMALYVGKEASNYLPGDSIVVNIENTTLKRNGYLVIEGLNTSNITKVSNVNTLKIINATASAIKSTPQNYEGTLVRVLGGQMYPKPEADEVFVGNKLMINGADTLNIVTQKTASFAQSSVPRNITVSGIMLGSSLDASSNYSIYPRYKTDILDVSDPEVPEYIGSSPVIITGFLPDASGSDGNYEYIQLKANVDINFKEVPFSLVTSTNAGSVLHSAGWASGGTRTYKFNLTSGSVKKGEYFYVGGHQMRINGANSTKIDNANWIRFINYGTNTGDGFGDKSSGLMPNSGNAGGIAIFIGTNVSEQSIPIDVIFYGGNGTASIISEDKTLGYRIGNTDLYSQFSIETGDLTPFFSMGNGNNDFRFPHQSKESLDSGTGIFYKLGGKFDINTRKWIEPRNATIISMSKESVLSDIETGEGITIQE